ncbi:hypothetical protein C1646_767075 [Rhizophagus diaphanus]|nr:hypothetical protein C1646_767075 [Rhizophagus diaphanus] [Rhizophagus sp. MUCL 43196]
MDVNPDQRPKAGELFKILKFWYNTCDSNEYYQEKEKFGHKEKEIKVVFNKADKEIPNISTSYEKNPDAIYTSRVFTFNNLPSILRILMKIIHMIPQLYCTTSHPTSLILISPLSTSPPPSSPTHASIIEDSTYSSSNYDYDITEFNFILRPVMKK